MEYNKNGKSHAKKEEKGKDNSRADLDSQQVISGKFEGFQQANVIKKEEAVK